LTRYGRVDDTLRIGSGGALVGDLFGF